MSKRISLLQLCCTLLFVLIAGCAPAAAPAAPVAPAAAGTVPAAEEATGDLEIAPIKIALIIPSSTSDISWSQSIYASLMQIQAEAGEGVVEVAYSENMFSVPGPTEREPQ